MGDPATGPVDGDALFFDGGTRLTPVNDLIFRCALSVRCGSLHAAAPKLLLEEPFTEPLSAEGFWQLGTVKQHEHRFV